MPLATPSSVAFELKSAALPLVAVVLRTTDLTRLATAFDARFADGPALFDNDPVAIDLAPVREVEEPIDFELLTALLRTYRMLPIAAKGGNARQMEDALAAGLSEAHGAAARAEPAVENDAAWSAPAPVPTVEPAVPRAALVVDKPLRSGQRVYAKGRDLIVLAVVSFGAEVIADGSIHVYAPLRGRALAGALGRHQRRASSPPASSRSCCRSPASGAPPRPSFAAGGRGQACADAARRARSWSSNRSEIVTTSNPNEQNDQRIQGPQLMAKIVVVTSGKGGVGKTTTSASFASGLALAGHKTAVIDFDVGLRNLDLIMGCERRVVYDLINVIHDEANLNQALIKDKQCDNLFVLPPRRRATRTR